MSAISELNNGCEQIKNFKEYKFFKKTEIPLGQKFFVRGVYIARGKYGFQSVIVFDNGNEIKGRYSFNDNGKKHDIIIKDSGLVQAIKNSSLTITFERYHSKKYNVESVGATFEIEQNPIY